MKPGSAAEEDDGSFVIPFIGPSSSSAMDVQKTTTVCRKQKWDKRHACLFCEKLYLKIARHLEDCHSEEPRVARAIAYPKGSKERKEAWIILRNDGDYSHNFKVLKQKKGLVIPKYRASGHVSKTPRTVGDYVPCQYCKAMYVEAALREHERRCLQKPDSNVKKLGVRGQAVRSGRLLLPVPDDVTTSFYGEVLNHMSNDDVTQVVKNDSLILLFGQRKWDRKDADEHTANTVSCKMRELGRLLLACRELGNKITSIDNCLKPGNFNSVINAVKHVAGFDEATRKYKTPTLAMSLGYSLKKCAKLLRTSGLIEEDAKKTEKADTFLELYDDNWSDRISSGAQQNLDINKSNKPQVLPLCNDVHTLYAHLRKETAKLRQQVQSDDSLYPAFAKTTMCEITLFNRKRGGEVQRLKVQDLKAGMKASEETQLDDEVEASLSKLEIKMCKLMQRVEFRGKMGRRVALLLTPNMASNIKVLLELHAKLKISGPFIFQGQAAQRPYRGSAVLQEVASGLELKLPEAITWMCLRQQIATMAQVYELSNFQKDQLAQFMGHSMRVHEHYYRMPMDLLQRAKLSKYLIAVNTGQEPSDSDVSIDPGWLKCTATNFDNKFTKSCPPS